VPESLNQTVWVDAENLSVDLLVLVSMGDHFPPSILVVVVFDLLTFYREMLHAEIHTEVVGKFAHLSSLFFVGGFDFDILFIFDDHCDLGVSRTE
jgi:hypothetical protein